jgi:hypothetical protein
MRTLPARAIVSWSPDVRTIRLPRRFESVRPLTFALASPFEKTKKKHRQAMLLSFTGA